MRNLMVVVLAVFFSVYMFGCDKKQVSLEDQEALSMETMSTLSPDRAMTEIRINGEKIDVSSSAVKLEPLPPPGPYKPTAIQIQTALKNADFYAGSIDGKIGPMSRKAIIEFQKANALVADGKVGPKTWAVLSQYLNPTPEASQ
jgi:peptidoglycan hydrolase-like protein with peptidoglycan-binding domain